jgi:glycosyltransferase involved in cell wall biosynthesis
MKKILHIAPHLGGGVGQVLGNISKESNSLFENEFILLDRLGDESIKNIRKYSLPIYPIGEAQKKINQADILQIDWWNHPILVKFLSTYQIPACRLLIYSHISGLYYPNLITKEIISFSDRFVVSTDYSLKQHRLLQKIAKKPQKTIVSSIHSCSGLSRVINVKKKKHNSFNIGYIGTLDFSKLHPDFIKMSASVNIKNAKYIICGTGNDFTKITQQINQLGNPQRYDLRGYVEDIAPVFSILDILGYPLNEHHYGTGEQVLIESQGAGVPAVVMNNGPERSIIKHGYNGLVAKSTGEYSAFIEYLASHPAEVRTMGQNARTLAIKKYAIQVTLGQFDNLYNEMMAVPKRKRFPIKPVFINKCGGFTYFIQAIGDYKKPYIESVTSRNLSNLFIADKRLSIENVPYTSASKGTLFHYQRYFPDDMFLLFWCGLVMLEINDHQMALTYLNKARKNGFAHWRLYWYLWKASYSLAGEINNDHVSITAIKKAENAYEILCDFFGKIMTESILRRVNGFRKKK